MGHGTAPSRIQGGGGPGQWAGGFLGCRKDEHRIWGTRASLGAWASTEAEDARGDPAEEPR